MAGMVVIQEDAVGVAVAHVLLAFFVVVGDFLGLQLAAVDGEDRAAEVVCAPVGHAAAGIIGERTPTGAVDGEAAAATIGMIRGPGRRAEPHVPVHACREPAGRPGSTACESGPTLTLIDLIGAQFAAPALVDRPSIVFQHPLAAAGNDAAITPGRRDHQRAFAEGLGLGLLAIHVLAVAAGLDHDDRVPMVGRGTMDGVDIRAGQQVAEVVVGLAIVVVVVIVDAIATSRCGRFRARRRRQHTARRRDRGTPLGRRDALISDTDAAHDDPLAGRRTAVGAEGRAGDQVGAGRRGRGRCLEKVSPIGTLFHGIHFLS